MDLLECAALQELQSLNHSSCQRVESESIRFWWVLTEALFRTHLPR
jgi:hypothetical protein